jgi:hypothetical protein
MAMLGSAAHAVATGTAEIGNLRITLYDLNPNDGIAPGFSFLPGAISIVAAGVDDYANAQFLFDRADGVASFDPVAVQSTSPLGDARASVTGDGSAEGVVATAQARAQGFGGNVDTWVQAEALPVLGGFSLTPWTAVRFEADTVVTATTTVGCDDRCWWYEVMYASASLGVEVDGPVREQHIAYRDAQARYAPLGNGVFGGETVDNSGLLGLTFANASALETQANFYMSAFVSGASPFPVPEPGTWALMLAGLGTFGLIASRRQQRGRQSAGDELMA